jgi:hypothetical protein
MSVVGKSLELIAKLQDKILISHKGKKKPENWDENEEENDTEEVEVESSDNIVVEDMDNVTQWDVVVELNKMTIHKLVTEVLNLPPTLLSRFEVEATRLQLGTSLYNCKSTDCIQGCDGQSDEGSSEFVDDVYNDEDSYENDESEWFMSSDEDANYVFSDTELETDTDESFNTSDVDSDDLDIRSPVEMDVESTIDEDSC